MHRTIILTGIPRSGSSLSCNLLNRFENTLALLEPMRVLDSDPVKGKIQACKDVVDFVFENRRKVIYESKVISGTINGKIATNTFGNNKDHEGLRKAVIQNSEITMQRDDLRNDFTLLLKHPAFFTAILEDLVNFFECYATIRNPLSILASWQTIDVPINRGYLPAGQRFEAQLENQLNAIEDRLERQLLILDWFFKKYHDVLERNHIIRYEDIIKSNGLVFEPLAYNGKLTEQLPMLQSQNSSDAYQEVDIANLYDALMQKHDAYYWHYYTPDDIEAIYIALKA
ncbi:MAG: hypothetical protein JXQ76_07955 [Campylobacterales bacterium]|nr:hypothetical protein [Campylobacterales bacterium]